MNSFNLKHYRMLSISFLVLCMLVIAGQLYRQYEGILFDDAYMFLRYAIHFTDGHGIAWNPGGPQTYGVTSLLYFVAVLIAYNLFPLEADPLLYLLASFFGLLALAMLAYTCSRFSKSELFKGRFLGWAALIASFSIITPHFIFHCRSGMDTTLGLLCNTIFIFVTLLAFERQNRSSLLFLSIAGYLAFLARPDSLIYVVSVPTLLFLLHDRSRVRDLLVYGGGLIVLLLLDTLFKYYVFGDPLPLPYYAKKAGYYQSYAGFHNWGAIQYFRQILFVCLPFIVCIFAFVTKSSWKLVFAFLLPVVVTYSYYLTVVQIMGYYARFYFAGIPFVVIAGALCVDRYFATHGLKKLSHVPQRLIGLTAFYVVFLSPFASSYWLALQDKLFPNNPPPHIDQYTIAATTPLPDTNWNGAMQGISKVMFNIDTSTITAMSEHGALGALAPQIKIIDVVGLHDPYYAHNGFDSDHFFAREPDFIVIPLSDYGNIVAKIVNHKYFQEHYEYYPTAFKYGVALKRDSPHYDRMDAMFQKAWELTYPGFERSDYVATFVD